MMSTHDRFELRVMFRTNPIRSWDAARPFLQVLLREMRDLAPTAFYDGTGALSPLSMEAIARYLGEADPSDDLTLRDAGGGIEVVLIGYGDELDPGGKLTVRIPFERVAGHGALILDLVARLCEVAAPLYGWGHSMEDLDKHRDPNVTNARAPKQVYQAYWLTVFGAPMVQSIGTERLAATPVDREQVLRDGSVLLVTSPDPEDVISPAARAAQARALVHLRPELDEATVLRELVARSERAQPVAPATPKPAVAPKVAEWRPASDALPEDVNVAATTRQYANDAENYISGFHGDIDGLVAESPDSLPRIDRYFLTTDHWRKHSVAELERLFLPALGAYLARMMIRELGGHWAPRGELEESQVIVGDRAWLPFLRVKHFLQSAEAARGHSLAAFFDAARRHGSGTPPKH